VRIYEKQQITKKDTYKFDKYVYGHL